MDGYLLGLSLEHEAGNADNVADVVLAKVGKLLLRQVILADVELDLSPVVLYVAEDRLAHASLGHNAACDLNVLAVKGVVIRLDLLGICASYEAGAAEWVSPLLLKCGQLISAYQQQLGKLLLLRIVSILLAHTLPRSVILDGHDRVLQSTDGSLDLDGVACDMTVQSSAEGRVVRDHALHGVCLLRADHGVFLNVAV